MKQFELFTHGRMLSGRITYDTFRFADSPLSSELCPLIAVMLYIIFVFAFKGIVPTTATSLAYPTTDLMPLRKRTGRQK